MNLRSSSGWLVLGLSFLLLAGCGDGGDGPSVINHPEPEMEVDFSPF